MLMNLVCYHNSYKLCNAWEQQVCMKRFLVLGFTAGHAKTVFEMVDWFFNISPDFVNAVSLFGAPGGSGIGAEILFRIHIKHPATGGSGAGVLAIADTSAGLGLFAVLPFHFGTYKLHCRKAAANQCPLFQFVFQRNIRLFKRCFLQKVFIDFNGIKSRRTPDRSLGQR